MKFKIGSFVTDTASETLFGVITNSYLHDAVVPTYEIYWIEQATKSLLPVDLNEWYLGHFFLVYPPDIEDK